MSLTGNVSGAAFQLCLYFVSIKKKKITEGVKLLKHARTEGGSRTGLAERHPVLAVPSQICIHSPTREPRSAATYD